MKYAAYILIIVFIIAKGQSKNISYKLNNLNLSEKELSVFEQNKGDSVYIKAYDSLGRDSIIYKLIYRNINRVNTVYKIIDMEGAIDFVYDFDYKNSKVSYKCFAIYYSIATTQESILFDKKHKKFYITEMFNLSESDDEIVKKSVSFENQTVLIKRKMLQPDHLDRYYKIKFRQIWP